MIIDCISDLHGHYSKLEGGDLLIIAGDLTARDTKEEHEHFIQWLRKQEYKYKIFIAGNHDNFYRDGEEFFTLEDNIAYLCDSGTEFEWFETEDTKSGPKHLDGCRHLKLKIWGSPWTKSFPDMNHQCKAFTLDTEEELEDKFSSIPDDVDILITHSPPFWILDKTQGGKRVGSKYLTGALEYSFRPDLWVVGHIHESYGIYEYKGGCSSSSGTTIVNASHLNERYEPVNPPVRIIL